MRWASSEMRFPIWGTWWRTVPDASHIIIAGSSCGSPAKPTIRVTQVGGGVLWCGLINCPLLTNMSKHLPQASSATIRLREPVVVTAHEDTLVMESFASQDSLALNRRATGELMRPLVRLKPFKLDWLNSEKGHVIVRNISWMSSLVRSYDGRYRFIK